MLDIIEWLLTTEKQAQIVYAKAAEYYSDDNKLYPFLKNLADEKIKHHQLILRVTLQNVMSLEYEPSLILDCEFQKRISATLTDLSNHIEEHTLTKTTLYELLINAEFTELNDIFFKVVKTLKVDILEINNIRKGLLTNFQYIRLFIKDNPVPVEKIELITKFKHSWKDKILIVDDEIIMLELLGIVFEEEGIVEKAYNGAEALEKVNNNYYKLIISDVNMPVMDGMTFFEKARELYPNLSERVIFLTGYLSNETISFFKQNNIEYLEKPVNLSEIKEKALQLLVKD